MSSGDERAASVADLAAAAAAAAAAAGPGSVAKAAKPTMMSQEARDMIQGEDGLAMWRERYYMEKLEVARGDVAGRRKVAAAYIEGLHWVLEYYYRGVASWNWFYPYHYAPMASELVSLNDIKVTFTQGKPFRPFEQLLAVLPSASCAHLPSPFRRLMTDPGSPIADFYPTTFDVDMEGKRAEWEGVVKVPFVDEVRLLKAASSIRPEQLTQAERSRNELGNILVFTYDGDSEDKTYCASTLPNSFRDVVTPLSRCTERPMPPSLPVGEYGFKPTQTPGTTTGLQAPTGVVTLKTMVTRVVMRMAAVNVLGMPSKKESLIITIRDLREVVGTQVTAAQVAPSLLGQRCYVRWPYLQEARITKVSDVQGMVYLTSHSQPQTKLWQSQEAQRWSVDASQVSSELLTKYGVDVGRMDLMVGVKLCKGYVQHLDGSIEKTYSHDEVQFPLQAIVRQKPKGPTPGPSPVSPHPAPAPARAGADPGDEGPITLEVQPGMKVVFLGKQYYGWTATVLPDLSKGLSRKGSASGGKQAGASAIYRLAVEDPGAAGEPAARSARRIARETVPRYIHSGEVARRVGMSPRALGRLTGNLWVTEGDDRYDIGIAIKAGGKNLCVPGYSAPASEGSGWTYSGAMVEVLQQYKAKFPWVIAALDGRAGAEADGPGAIRLAALLPTTPTSAERKAAAQAIQAWLKSLPLAHRPLVKSTVQMMTEAGISQLQLALPPAPAKAVATVELENVPPALLLLPYLPSASSIKLAVQGGEFDLGDRVVSVASSIPPFGLRGTIIGVYDDACEVLFDADFPGGTNLGGRVKGSAGCHVPRDLLLNLARPATVPLAKTQIPRQVASKASPWVQPAAAALSRQTAAAAAATAAVAGAGAEADAAGLNGAPASSAPLSPLTGPLALGAMNPGGIPLVAIPATLSPQAPPPPPPSRLLMCAGAGVATPAPGAHAVGAGASGAHGAGAGPPGGAGAPGANGAVFSGVATGTALLHQLTQKPAASAHGPGAAHGPPAGHPHAAGGATAAAGGGQAAGGAALLALLRKPAPGGGGGGAAANGTAKRISGGGSGTAPAATAKVAPAAKGSVAGAAGAKAGAGVGTAGAKVTAAAAAAAKAVGSAGKGVAGGKDRALSDGELVRRLVAVPLEHAVSEERAAEEAARQLVAGPLGRAVSEERAAGEWARGVVAGALAGAVKQEARDAELVCGLVSGPLVRAVQDEAREAALVRGLVSGPLDRAVEAEQRDWALVRDLVSGPLNRAVTHERRDAGLVKGLVAAPLARAVREEQEAAALVSALVAGALYAAAQGLDGSVPAPAPATPALAVALPAELEAALRAAEQAKAYTDAETAAAISGTAAGARAGPGAGATSSSAGAPGRGQAPSGGKAALAAHAGRPDGSRGFSLGRGSAPPPPPAGTKARAGAAPGAPGTGAGHAGRGGQQDGRGKAAGAASAGRGGPFAPAPSHGVGLRGPAGGGPAGGAGAARGAAPPAARPGAPGSGNGVHTKAGGATAAGAGAAAAGAAGAAAAGASGAMQQLLQKLHQGSSSGRGSLDMQQRPHGHHAPPHAQPQPHMQQQAHAYLHAQPHVQPHAQPYRQPHGQPRGSLDMQRHPQGYAPGHHAPPHVQPQAQPQAYLHAPPHGYPPHAHVQAHANPHGHHAAQVHAHPQQHPHAQPQQAHGAAGYASGPGNAHRSPHAPASPASPFGQSNAAAAAAAATAAATGRPSLEGAAAGRKLLQQLSVGVGAGGGGCTASGQAAGQASAGVGMGPPLPSPRGEAGSGMGPPLPSFRGDAGSGMALLMQLQKASSLPMPPPQAAPPPLQQAHGAGPAGSTVPAGLSGRALLQHLMQTSTPTPPSAPSPPPAPHHQAQHQHHSQHHQQHAFSPAPPAQHFQGQAGAGPASPSAFPAQHFQGQAGAGPAGPGFPVQHSQGAGPAPPPSGLSGTALLRHLMQQGPPAPAPGVGQAPYTSAPRAPPPAPGAPYTSAPQAPPPQQQQQWQQLQPQQAPAGMRAPGVPAPQQAQGQGEGAAALAAPAPVPPHLSGTALLRHLMKMGPGQ